MQTQPRDKFRSLLGLIVVSCEILCYGFVVVALFVGATARSFARSFVDKRQ